MGTDTTGNRAATPPTPDIPPLLLRRTTAHTIGITPDGRAARPHGPAGTPVTGARVAFGDDPAAIARTAAGLPADTPLTPLDTRVETAAVTTPDGPTHLHVDRVYYTVPATAPLHLTLPMSAALALPAHPAATDLLAAEPPHTGHRIRRFSAYGLVTDPTGRLLLSKIAPGYPGEGTWHLPGGGVDHGESAREALTREIYEETGQHGGVGALITIDHHHRTGQTGPEGSDTEIYAVWVFFHVHVDRPGEPHVTETAGSTVDCAWFTPDDLPHIPLSTTARKGLTALTGH